MAERVVKVRLLAEISDFDRNMMKAAQAARTVGSEAEKLEQKKQAFERFGAGLMAAGTAVTAVSVLSARAAMDWESSWAGVTKTVEGTPEQLAAVEAGLRGLTSVLPASHDEIAAVAEAAGQLGIQTPNVVAFTKTMINLGETTNLSANDAATSLARFVNIMGTSQSQVSNLGSALVGLGNNYATTEAEIMEMAMRLAGAGKQVGLSEGQVLGLSTALSSVGIEAEAGGSAMSKVMIDIAASVETGGEKLDKFAAAAGMSAKEFSAQWRSDPAAALAAFVKGLSNAESQGKSTLGILADLGITEVRMRDALLRSSAAADQFAGAMAMGNEEFDRNNALTAEAAKRYETVEARLAMAGNAVRDAAIEFGQVFLPAVKDAATGVVDIAGAFGRLPDPVQGVVSVLTSAVGVTALLAGGAMLAVPKIAELKVAMELLGVTGASSRAALASMWAFLTGPYGVALVGAATATVVLSKALGDLKTSTEEFQNVIRNAESVGDLFDAADSALPWLSRLKEATSDAEAFRQKLDVIAGNDFLRGLDRSASQLKNSLADIGIELAKTAQTDLPAAQNAFRLLATEMDLSKSEQQDLLNSMGDYKKALQAQATEQDINISTMSEAENAQALLNLAMGEAPDPAREATDAYKAEADEVERLDAELSQLIDSINKANGVGQDAVATNAAYQSALAGISEEIANQKAAYKETHGTLEGFTVSLDESTAAGSANAAMLGDVAGKAQDAAAAQFEQDKATMSSKEAADKYAATLAAQRQAFIDSAVAAGFNKDEVVKLADKVFALPPEKAIKILADTGSATWAIDNLINSYNGRVIRLRAAIDRGAANQELAGIVGVGMLPHAAGALYGPGGVKEFAGGGFEPGIYPYTPGGIHKFAEEYGEAYISMDPRRRERSERVWVQAGQRMGFMNAQQASSQAQLPPIYIQSPVTGEYLLARTAEVARSEIGSYDAARERSTRGGWSGQ